MQTPSVPRSTLKVSGSKMPKCRNQFFWPLLSFYGVLLACLSPCWASQYVVPSLYPVWSPLKVFGQRARCVVLKPPARCLQPPSPLPHPRTSKVDMTRRHVHVHAPARIRNLLNPINAVRCRDPGGLGWWGGVHEPRCIHLSLTNPTHNTPCLLTSYQQSFRRHHQHDPSLTGHPDHARYFADRP